MSKEILKRTISSLILFPLAIFLIIKGSLYFNIFLLICFGISVYEWNKMKLNISLNYFGIFFLIFSFYTVFSLRNINQDEYDFFLIVILICIFTDIGGFVFGKILKGPKLTRISPNKTYAGMMGSYIMVFILIFTLNKIEISTLIKNNSLLNIYIFSLITSTISQLGDIIISYFKRKSKIKNTGIIIPGHGGLLDRIDGMIFAFPFSYAIYLLSILKI